MCDSNFPEDGYARIACDYPAGNVPELQSIHGSAYVHKGQSYHLLIGGIKGKILADGGNKNVVLDACNANDKCTHVQSDQGKTWWWARNYNDRSADDWAGNDSKNGKWSETWVNVGHVDTKFVPGYFSVPQDVRGDDISNYNIDEDVHPKVQAVRRSQNAAEKTKAYAMRCADRCNSSKDCDFALLRDDGMCFLKKSTPTDPKVDDDDRGGSRFRTLHKSKLLKASLLKRDECLIENSKIKRRWECKTNEQMDAFFERSSYRKFYGQLTEAEYASDADGPGARIWVPGTAGEEETKPSGLIIGIAVGVGVLLICCIGFIVLRKAKKAKNINMFSKNT